MFFWLTRFGRQDIVPFIFTFSYLVFWGNSRICIGSRPRSHYSEIHNDGDGNVYGDGKKRGKSVTLKTLFS